MRDVEEFTAWLDAQPEVQPAFTPEAVQLLDRVRALSMKMPGMPSPGFIVSMREALGLTQVELAERIKVAPMTVSRWERGTLKPGPRPLAALNELRREAVRRGVAIPQ